MAPSSPDGGIPVSAPSVSETPQDTTMPPTYDDMPSLISSASDAGDAHTALDIGDAETPASQADLPAYAPPSTKDLEAFHIPRDSKVAVVFASPAPKGACSCGARAAGSAGAPGTCPARRGLLVLAFVLALLGLLALLDQDPGYFGSDTPCEHFGGAGGSNAVPHMHDHLTGPPLPGPSGAPADGDTVWFTWSRVEVTEVVGVGARAPDAAPAPAEGNDVPTLEMTVARTGFAKWGGPGPYPVPQGGVRPAPLPLPISPEDAAAAVEGEKA